MMLKMIQGPILHENINHAEIYVLKTADIVPSQRYSVNLSDEKFKMIFEKVRKKYKYFKKSNMNTLNGSLEHIISENGNEYVQESIIDNCSHFSKNNLDFLKVSYDKKNKSVFSFPSNEKIYDIVHNQRYTFKLNQSVYLNFQISESFNGERNRQVFFNVNRSKSYDDSMVCKAINDTTELF